MLDQVLYRETDLYPGFGQYFDVKEILLDTLTEHQHLQIFDTGSPVHGRAMALDGILQVTEGGNLSYHEYIAQLPVIVHGSVRRVLVIGAGDGGVIHQLFRNQSIEEVVMIEIDEQVTAECRTHMPSISNGAFTDPRLDLRFMDGQEYVTNATQEFDLIIIDSTDPVGPGARLFTPDFYQDCVRLLNERGILITQNGVPRFQASELRDSMRFLRGLLGHAQCYTAAMDDYPGGQMALGFASNYPYDPGFQMLGEYQLRLSKLSFRRELRHVSALTIGAAFALEPWVEEIIIG